MVPRRWGCRQTSSSAASRDAMELFQVADLADASPYQLSGGQKKRVALAAVVSMNPDILVLDEPTNGLNEISCDIVVNFLLAYVAAGKTVLMSTHHQDLVRRLACPCNLLIDITMWSRCLRRRMEPKAVLRTSCCVERA